MVGEKVEMEVYADPRVGMLCGQLKDAFIETHPSKISKEIIESIPSDEQMRKIAAILIARGAVEDVCETPYKILRNAVDRALDVPDPSGTTLRDFIFGTNGFMKDLQKHLVNGLRDSELYKE